MRPYPTILLLTALALIGYLLLPRLSIRWQPSNATSSLRISYSWRGADPAAVEQQLTAPLEAAFALVRDVEGITSVSRQGQGSITLAMRRGADADFVRFNVASQVRRLYPALPPGVSYPAISVSAGDDDQARERPVLTYVLTGPDSPSGLYRYASEELTPRLSLVPGLSRMAVTGGNRDHWRIQLNTDRLASIGLHEEQLQQHLQGYFSRSGLGFIRTGAARLSAYVDAAIAPDSLTAATWAAVPLPPIAGEHALRLGDVATIQRVPLPAQGYYRVNGKNSIRLLAYATDDANRIALANQLGTRVRALENTLRKGYQLLLEEDATRFLREELAKTRQRTVLSMGILLVFVLLAYRSFRRLGVVLFSLAVNLGLAFLLYWLLGVELNLYAFAGIAVSFGIMVDNIIIVLDGLRRRGGPLAPAIIGATLTTLAGLSVIWFLSEDLRQQLYELARVMAINLTTSILVALTLVPGLVGGAKRGLTVRRQGAEAGDPELVLSAGGTYERMLAFLVSHKKKVLLLTILAFGLPVWWLPNRLEDNTLYNETIGSDFYRDRLRPYVNKCLGGTFRLFSYYVYEGSGFQPQEETRLYVGAALPDGATLDQLNEVIALTEGYLARFPGKIDRYTSQVYSGQNARIEITFPNGGRGSFPYTLKNRLTSYATNFGGVKWNIYGVGQGFSNDVSGRPVSFNVTLKGYNQAGLDKHAERLAQLLLQHPRVQEVNRDANINWWEKDRYEYLATVRNADLARNGFSRTQLRAAMSWYDRNDRPDFYLRDGEPVALLAAEPTRYDRWQLENGILGQGTERVAFSTVADLEKRTAPQSLHKEDQQYLRRLAFEYLGASRFGSKHLEACLDTLRAELPLGFTAERRGFSRASEARKLSGLMGLAVVLIFFICALLFESLRQAFNVVLLIPVSCIGIFLTFYWFNVRLDQGGYTSFLLVTGLAVNGMILLVNEFNHLRRHHPGAEGPVLYATAVRHKLLPIVLTVISTAAGLVPFLLGGRNEVFWYALAAGTIGGLAFSVVVLLVISPVFFLRLPLRSPKAG